MSGELEISITRLDASLPLPTYAHEGDAGIDLYCAEDVSLKPGQRAAVATGIAVAIPPGYAGFVQPRSGQALRKGLSIVNTPGLVDSGYRGEIKVVAINLDPDEPLELRRGDRLAQLVILPVAVARLVEVDRLPKSSRGEGGFGSTG